MNYEMLTNTEVAGYLKMSKSKVYQMVKEGELPAVRIRKNVRVLQSDLDAWIQTQKDESSVVIWG